MKIAINTRLLLKNRLEGIGWFSYETLKHISKNHPEHEFIFIFDRPYAPEFIFSENIKAVVTGPPARHPVLFWIWFNYRIPWVLKKEKADLFLSPDGYLSLKTDVPQLAVMHDLSFVHRPKDLPWLQGLYYNYFFPKFAQKAVRIATVSMFSKQDIANTYQIDPHKIDVVYNGIKPGFTKASDEEVIRTRIKYSGGLPYFIYVGALHPRKNIPGLLKAFDRFKSENITKTKLLIVGSRMHKTGEIANTINQMQFSSEVIFTGRVTEKELHHLLSAALALVYVPFFEGFGLPITEAMQAGVPVICSNTTSMPEVGGEAVLYVDPGNVPEIAAAMYKLEADAHLRSSLIKKGYEQKEKFSWEKTAALLWKSIEAATQTS